MTADILRILANIVRIGSIDEIDHEKALCRVKTGDNVTNWVQWGAVSGDTIDWRPPTLGEQCLLLSPSGEISAGVAIIGLYQDKFPRPSSSQYEFVRQFPDGAKLSYNHNTGHLDVSGIKTANIDAENSITLKAGNTITLDAPDVISTGKTTSNGLLTWNDGVSGHPRKDGGQSLVTGDFDHIGTWHNTGNITSNDVSLSGHVHGGVIPGGSNTSTPNSGGSGGSGGLQ